MPVNVLYLGMAYDIMAPLLLVPDFDTLYALNLQVYGTWEESKNIIRNVLLQGNDKNIAESFWFHRNDFNVPEGRNWRNVHTLEGPSEILSDEDIPNPECSTKSVWKLQFMYNGKLRNLIYYYDFDFEQCVWPSEIKDIHYHIWNGSYAWEDMIENSEEELFRNMMMERSAPESYVFALSFNHKKFPEHIWLYNGHERFGHSIAKMKLNFSDPNWWKTNYRGNNNNQDGGKKRKPRTKRNKQRKQTAKRRKTRQS